MLGTPRTAVRFQSRRAPEKNDMGEGVMRQPNSLVYKSSRPPPATPPMEDRESKNITLERDAAGNRAGKIALWVNPGNRASKTDPAKRKAKVSPLRRYASYLRFS